MLGYYYHRHHFNLNSLHLKKMFFTGDAYRSIPFFIRNLSGFTEKKNFSKYSFSIICNLFYSDKTGFQYKQNCVFRSQYTTQVYRLLGFDLKYKTSQLSGS